MTRRRTRHARRAAGAGEAAHLERRRDVHRAVERAGRSRRPAARPARARRSGHRAGASAGPRRGAGSRPRARAPCASQARRERRAERQPAEDPQQLVGVDREPGERRDQDQQCHLQRDDRAVDERLDGRSPCPNGPSRRAARTPSAPSRETSTFIEHDRHGHDRRGPQRARQLAPDPGAGPRAEDGHQQRRAGRADETRMSAAAVSASAQAAATPARAPRAAGSRGGGRRASRPVRRLHRAPSCGSASGSPPASTATAKRLSQRLSRRMRAAATFDTRRVRARSPPTRARLRRCCVAAISPALAERARGAGRSDRAACRCFPPAESVRRRRSSAARLDVVHARVPSSLPSMAPTITRSVSGSHRRRRARRTRPARRARAVAR